MAFLCNFHKTHNAQQHNMQMSQPLKDLVGISTFTHGLRKKHYLSRERQNYEIHGIL
jgi:hypothetical protein